MADDLPSATPEISGNNKTAADEADRQRKANPEKKSRPRKPRTKKWFGLSETKWREIAGISVLIPWVWNEFLDTHNFSKLCLLAITIAVAQGATLTFFKSRWRGFILAIWLISLAPVAGVVWINSRPEPKPHLTFSMTTQDAPDDTLLLTNDFLNGKSVGDGHLEYSFGIAYLPLQFGKTNIEIIIRVRNDSQILAHDGLLAVTLPKGLIFEHNADWNPFEFDPPKTIIFGSSTNESQSWGYNLPDVLPGNSVFASEFRISNFEMNNAVYFSIFSRANAFPAESVTFDLFPFSLPTNFPAHKSFILEGYRTSSNTMGVAIEKIRDKLSK